MRDICILHMSHLTFSWFVLNVLQYCSKTSHYNVQLGNTDNVYK